MHYAATGNEALSVQWGDFVKQTFFIGVGALTLMVASQAANAAGIPIKAPYAPATVSAWEFEAGLRTSGYQLDRTKEISREFVISRGDAPVVFDFVEETFDEIALTVEREIAVALYLAIGLWWNHRRDCPLIESVDQRISVIGFVGEECTRINVFEQRLGASQVMDLPRRQHHLARISQGIDKRVDLGG